MTPIFIPPNLICPVCGDPLNNSHDCYEFEFYRNDSEYKLSLNNWSQRICLYSNSNTKRSFMYQLAPVTPPYCQLNRLELNQFFPIISCNNEPNITLMSQKFTQLHKLYSTFS